MATTLTEDIQLLTRLGLTTRQAKIYLTIAKIGKSKITTISSVAKIDRGNVYKTITKLQELNLVEKVIANPTVFQALPVSEGIALLLERKEKERAEVEANAKELLEKYRQDNEMPLNQDAFEFALIPEGKLTDRRIAEMWQTNESTQEALIYWKDFEHRTGEFVPVWRKLLKKGVKLRVVVFFPNQVRMPEIFSELSRQYDSFLIRRAIDPPQCTLSIVDEQKAFITLTPSLSSTPSFWVCNCVLVSLIREYFETVWCKSEALF